MKQLTIKDAIKEGIISVTERQIRERAMLVLTDLSDGEVFLQEEKVEGKPSFLGVFLVIDEKQYPEGEPVKYVHSVIM